jgi:hypothetical protein
VACPFFYPLEPSEPQGWSTPPRLPLGDLQQGECRAQAVTFLPEASELLKHCNSGYARGQCARFPEDAEMDAFRFHVASERGDRLEVLYIIEQACWPLRHGTLLVELSSPPELSGVDNLQRQAAAFAASYSKRRDLVAAGVLS